MKELLQDSINKGCNEKLVDGEFIKDLIENFEEKRKNWEFAKPKATFDPNKIKFRTVKKTDHDALNISP